MDDPSYEFLHDEGFSTREIASMLKSEAKDWIVPMEDVELRPGGRETIQAHYPSTLSSLLPSILPGLLPHHTTPADDYIDASSSTLHSFISIDRHCLHQHASYAYIFDVGDFVVHTLTSAIAFFSLCEFAHII